MGRITLKQAAAWCGGSVDPKYEHVEFFGACNDTRSLQPGQLFIALKGLRDGHDYIEAAIEKKAGAILCNECSADYPAIIVQDTRIALGHIAREERRRLSAKVIGVTGSVGKSTTKEMLASILESAFKTGKTPVNHNNDIGMPMAILALPDDTEMAVLEMGMNHFREMAYLSSVAQPDLAVIVNIGTMHIEHLGSQEGILKAKMEILEGMSKNAPLISNGDDRLLWKVHNMKRPHFTYAIQNGKADLIADHVFAKDGGTEFDVRWKDDCFHVELPMEGNHFVSDALAAISASLYLGVPKEKICAALKKFRNMDGRQEILKTGRYTIIKDCYNAGPESMEASLNVLGNQCGRKIAVLGEMLELGVCAEAEHFRVGRIAADKADLLLAYGPSSSKMVAGAITGGMINGKSAAYETPEELVKALKRQVSPGDVILVKGSRGMHMECIIDQFLKEEK